MTPKAIRGHIQDAYAKLDRLCDLATYLGERDLQTPFAKLVEAELEAEREHRKFGRRFTNGQTGYVVGALPAARYHAIKNVLDAIADPPELPTSWEGVDSYAPRVLTAYRVAEGLRGMGTERSAKRCKTAADLTAHTDRCTTFFDLYAALLEHPVRGIGYEDIAA